MVLSVRRRKPVFPAVHTFRQAATSSSPDPLSSPASHPGQASQPTKVQPWVRSRATRTHSSRSPWHRHPLVPDRGGSDRPRRRTWLLPPDRSGWSAPMCRPTLASTSWWRRRLLRWPRAMMVLPGSWRPAKPALCSCATQATAAAPRTSAPQELCGLEPNAASPPLFMTVFG